MYKTVIRLPRLGGNEAEAKILAWKKAPGEPFASDETLLEVETDKAVVEVPAPAAGVLRRRLKEADDHADYDEALAEVELEGEGPSDGASGEPEAAAPAAPSPPPPLTAAADGGEADHATAGVGMAVGGGDPTRRIASPAARRAARDAGIELVGLRGSGPRGRIVLRDLPSAAAVTAAAGDWHLRRWNAAAGASVAPSTVVLIHGLYGDVDTWAGLAKGLADAGQPVLALDLPLHGATRATARSLPEMVAGVRALLDAQVPGPRLLVGHSLGGAVAIRLAQADGGRRIDGLALIAPAGLGTEIDQGFIDGMLNAREPGLLRRELQKLTSRPQPLGEAWIAELHARLRERADDLRSLIDGFAVRGTQQIDLRADLAALAAQGLPVAVLWGRRDRILPWRQALDLPPSVALHLFAEAGHMPQTEQTAVVLQVLQQLARLAPPGPALRAA
ncbi:MAG: alpha/beta fold hydrolase [Proteobacteria bacterium]|nr:alpha/beta fold hydrolase [Pseudomonadota bacterium]